MVTLILTGLDGPPNGRASRADMGAAARRALTFPTQGAWYGGNPVHGPMPREVQTTLAGALSRPDLAPAQDRGPDPRTCTQEHLFNAPQTMRGQTTMEGIDG